MTNKTPRPTPATPAARRLRAAVYPLAGGDAGASGRALLAALRDDLDAIAGSDRMTSLERDRAAGAVLAAFKANWSREVVKAEAAHRSIIDEAKELAAGTRRSEETLSPLDVRRAERAADLLAKLPPGERAADLGRALDERDVQRLAAHALLDPTGAASKRAIAVATDPARFQRVLLEGRTTVEHLAAIRAVAAAIDELAGAFEPWRKAPSTGPDLMAVANGGIGSIVGQDVLRQLVPADVPGYLRGMMMPQPGPVAAPQGQQVQQDQHPPAGAA
jgi:hypothetical protein